MKNRLLILAFSGAFLTLAWTCSSTPAVDVKPPAADSGEAAEFFTQVMQTSKNPLIINMAREGLVKLRQPAANNVAQQSACSVQGPSMATSIATASPDPTMPKGKVITEVKLVPQIDNTYVVPAVVNRQHMATFLIDTGASYTVITPQMARQLGLSLRDNTTVPVTTANGTVSAPLVTIKQLSLGGLRVENVEAVVADLGDAPQISGLLGMSFFHGMELAFKQDRLLIGR